MLPEEDHVWECAPQQRLSKESPQLWPPQWHQLPDEQLHTRQWRQASAALWPKLCR